MTLIDSPDTLEDVPDLDLTAPLVSEDKPLRPHQVRALAQITDMHQARGIRRVMACGPTGCGKSRLGRAVAEQYEHPLCIVHTRGLLEQNRQTICRTVMIQQIAIAAKEGRLEALLEAIGPVDLVIEDECFTAATLVEPVGDVVAVSSRAAPSRLIEIDGVVSTPDHPYLTSKGWKRAEDVAAGDLCCVRRYLPGVVLQDPKDLLPEVSLEAIERDHELHEQARLSCKTAGRKQHHTQTGRARAPVQGSEGDRSQAEDTGRKRPWCHVAGASSDASYRAATRWTNDAGRRASAALQIRPSLPIGQAIDRGGWWEPLSLSSQSSGRAQDTALGWQRVDRVAVHELGGVGEYERVCPDGRVYNIETTSGVYLAGGKLVSNCHHYASPQWSVAHKLWTTAKRLGLTATPMRGDGKPLRPFYDELVTIATYSELIKAGILVPAVVEYPEGTSSKVGRSLRCDAADAYLKSGRGLRTMIFCEDTEHSRRTVQDLEKAGVRAAHVDGDTSDVKRTKILDALASGDLDVVSNCNVLTEGIDVPCTECVVLAKGYDTIGSMIQAAGRGLRSSPATGKTECLVLDLVGCTHTFGSPDDDKTYSLDGNAMDLQPGKIWVCGVCYRCFGPKIVGATKEGWEDEGGIIAERSLSAEDLAKREAWEAKREAAFADKAGREWITKKQAKERTKNMRDYRKKLALQLGAVVTICSLDPSKQFPKHTPCPHCAKERPRGNHEAKLQRKNPSESSYGTQGAPLTLQNPTNVEQALQSLTAMLDRAMASGKCLTSSAEEFKKTYAIEITVGWVKAIDARHAGKFRKYQEEWCDRKIKEGWKPGTKFFRVTKFFAAR